jgi:hypothetical protein
MGCDIHTHAECRDSAGKWVKIPGLTPFDWRSYGLYGWLADVRNYSAIPPVAERRGVPDDASAEVKEDYESWDCDAHSASWLSMAELLAFDYDAKCEDRRCTRQLGPNYWSGGETCEPGEGQVQTYREFLGEDFFKELDALKDAGAERVVFWFDN